MYFFSEVACVKSSEFFSDLKDYILCFISNIIVMIYLLFILLLRVKKYDK